MLHDEFLDPTPTPRPTAFAQCERGLLGGPPRASKAVGCRSSGRQRGVHMRVDSTGVPVWRDAVELQLSPASCSRWPSRETTSEHLLVRGWPQGVDVSRTRYVSRARARQHRTQQQRCRECGSDSSLQYCVVCADCSGCVLSTVMYYYCTTRKLRSGLRKQQNLCIWVFTY